MLPLEAKTCQYTADELLWQWETKKYISCGCYLCESCHIIASRAISPLWVRGVWRQPWHLITSGVQLTDQQCYQFTVTPVSIENLLQRKVATQWSAAIYSVIKSFIYNKIWLFSFTCLFFNLYCNLNLCFAKTIIHFTKCIKNCSGFHFPFLWHRAKTKYGGGLVYTRCARSPTLEQPIATPSLQNDLWLAKVYSHRLRFFWICLAVPCGGAVQDELSLRLFERRYAERLLWDFCLNLTDCMSKWLQKSQQYSDILSYNSCTVLWRHQWIKCSMQPPHE